MALNAVSKLAGFVVTPHSVGMLAKLTWEAVVLLELWGNLGRSLCDGFCGWFLLDDRVASR